VCERADPISSLEMSAVLADYNDFARYFQPWYGGGIFRWRVEPETL
jgi:hypothetical protein